MLIITIIFAALAGLFHVLFFLMESIFWMNPKVYKSFGIKTLLEAEQFKVSFFNQGFYNLFLAIGMFIGIYFMQTEMSIIGYTLVIFCCGSMLGASVVLFFSKPGMMRGVIIQGLCPLIALINMLIK